MQLKSNFRLNVGNLNHFQILIFSIFLFLFFPQSSYADNSEIIEPASTAPKIRKNKVINYSVLIEAPYSLKKLLKNNLDIVRFSKTNSVSKKQLNYLITALPEKTDNLLQTAGYFSSKTEIIIHHPSLGDIDATRLNQPEIKLREYLKLNEKDQLNLTIKVIPGKPTLIKKVAIDFSGDVNQEAPERKEIVRKAFTLETGDVFTQSAWDEAKNNALNELQSKRYLSAHIDHSEALINADNEQAELTVKFISGPTFYFGPVSYFGNKLYPKFIVEHVNPLTEGEIYSRRRANELQRQIQSTSYYGGVGVNVSDKLETANMAPVSVNLSEFPYHYLRTGIGYTTDRGPRLQGSYTYNNVFNRAWIFRTQGRLESKSRYGLVELAMPPDKNGYTNSLLGSYGNSDIENVEIFSTKIGLQRKKSMHHNDLTYSLMFYQDKMVPKNLPSQLAKALMPSFRWAHRDVNDPIYPKSGQIFSIDAGFAIKNVLSTTSFMRLYGQGQRYFSLNDKNLLIIRGDFGTILSKDDASKIPASLLFRTGGATTVRGYVYQSIGNQKDENVLPAKFQISSSAEYQHWFLRNWGGAVFVDTGSAFNQWRQLKFYSGMGVGLRWRSPVGPVNVDLAYGLRDKKIRPYITLGVAF